MSVFWGEVGTIFFDVYDFSVLLTVSIFFSEIGEVMASSIILGLDFFKSTMSIVPYLSTVSIVATNGFSISSKSPLVFKPFHLVHLNS